jgi:hypothetical protein
LLLALDVQGVRRFGSDYGRFGEAQKKLLRKEIEDVVSRIAKDSPSAEPLFYFDTTGKKRRRDGPGDALKDGEEEEEPEVRRDMNRANRAQQEMYQRQRTTENPSAAGTPRAAKAVATDSHTPAPAGNADDADAAAAVGSAVRPRAARTPRAGGGRRGGYSAQAEVPTVRFKDLGGIEQILQVSPVPPAGASLHGSSRAAERPPRHPLSILTLPHDAPSHATI